MIAQIGKKPGVWDIYNILRISFSDTKGVARKSVFHHLVVDPAVVLILVILSQDIFLLFNWNSRLSKDMTKPEWKDFLNSCSSCVAANNSGEVITAIPRFSLIVIILSFTFISLVFSSEIWPLAVIRSAPWSFPSSSSLLSMLELELVSFSLLNLEIVAY